MNGGMYPNQHISQHTKDVAETIYRAAWRLSDDDDIQEHLLQRKIEKLAEQKAEILAEKSNLILIKLLYQEMKCSISEIAHRMDKDEDFVINFLKKHHLSAE